MSFYVGRDAPNLLFDSMSSLQERIVDLALLTFKALPVRSKPRIHPVKGVLEWIPMSAIVLAEGNRLSTTRAVSIVLTGPSDADSSTEKLACVALA